MFGAAYFILPRVTGHEWRSPLLVKAHFGATVLGILLLVVSLAAGGWSQGHMLNNAAVVFRDITNAMLPWFALRTAGLAVLFAGHLAFFVNFFFISCPINSKKTAVAQFNVPPALEGVKP